MRIQHKKLRRILIPLFLVPLLLLAAADCFLEIHGVPQKGVKLIQKFCARNGYTLHVKKIYAGVVNGIICIGFQLDGKENAPSIGAAEIRAEFRPWKLLRGILLPFDFTITNGRLSFPVFPEYGSESSRDRLLISDLNALMTGIPGKLRVTGAEGAINGIRFFMRGTIDNLLHYSSAKGIDIVRKTLTKSGIPDDKKSAYLNFIENIPLALRKRAILSLQRMDRKNFPEQPSCELVFHLDINNFEKCTADASFLIPPFRYGNLQLEGIEEHMTLKNGLLSIDKIRILLKDGSYAEASGNYDGNGQSAKGTILGECSVEDIILFLDDTIQSEIAERVRFGKERVKFNGTLENFTLSGQFIGHMKLILPSLEIGHLALKGADISIFADRNVLEGVLHSAGMKNGGRLSGRIRFQENRFKAQLKGTVPPGEMKLFLPAGIADFIYRDIRFGDGKEQLAFSGNLTGSIRDMRTIKGNFRIETPEISVRGIDVRKMEADLQFTTDSVRVSSMEADLADGSRILGDLYCQPEEHYISARVVCSGAPYKLVEALGGAHKKFIQSLTRSIEWPENKNYVEASASIHVDYGKDPFYYMSGSLVIRDFLYEKIPFRYGAARFVIDADNHLILPDAVLETKDGKMSISADYTPAGREIFSGNPGGKLNFALVSTMAGNDMIRSLYPLWKSEFIDFPHSVNVKSKGMIDYAAPQKTHFDATISNGDCEWHKMKIQDIDTTLHYADNVLSFRNAGGTFAEGRLQMDYSYSFATEKGKIATRLTGANPKAMIENFGQKNVAPEYRNGVFTANLQADLSYNSKDELMLQGDGGFELTGSNLWTVPLLGSFLRIIGKAWSLDSFGSITKVDGIFILEGDKLVFRKLRSNGGFVSLNANGFYRWENNYFDVNVRAELLKNTLPFDVMSHLLTPVSWILERRLKGNFNTFQWE